VTRHSHPSIRRTGTAGSDRRRGQLARTSRSLRHGWPLRTWAPSRAGRDLLLRAALIRRSRPSGPQAASPSGAQCSCRWAVGSIAASPVSSRGSLSHSPDKRRGQPGNAVGEPRSDARAISNALGRGDGRNSRSFDLAVEVLVLPDHLVLRAPGRRMQLWAAAVPRAIWRTMPRCRRVGSARRTGHRAGQARYRAGQDGDIGGPYPDQEDDHAGEAAVDLVVVAEVSDLQGEQSTRNQP
jgi:hypothetical protein